MKTDPVLLEILSNKVTAVAEEMGITLQRTGRTLYVKETADYGTALATLDGKFFGFPVGIGVAGFVDLDCGATIRAVGDLDPGDVIITNHPYASGGLATHTPDIQLVRPYFHDGRIVAYGWSFIHSADIGGKVPSSVSPTNTELYQEGFLIPPVKLVKRGDLDPEFLTLYRANCRTPDLNVGDIKAMLAALEVGQRRVSEMIEQHGLEAFLQAQEDLIEYAALKAREALRQIPDGTYHFWDYLDDDMFSAVPARIRVAMTVRDGQVHLDYTGTDPETRAPFNVVTLGRSHPWLTLRLLAYVYTRDPTCPVNSGVFRNVTVNVPKGTLLNPEFPSPAGVRAAPGVRCYDVLNGALAAALPDFMPGTPGGNIVPMVLVEPDEGEGRRRVTVIQFLVGATGARQDGDGVDGRDPSFTNMANNPIETVEAEASAIVREYGVSQDSGGPGQWRGGCGQMISFEVLRDGCSVLGRGLERLRFQPWGLAGGGPGARARVVLNLGRPDERELGKIDVVPVNRGDVVTAIMPGAGGYGDPFLREPALVLRDMRRGFVSAGAAERDYGVVIRDDQIDEAATARTRGNRPPRDGAPMFRFGPERDAWESVFDDERMNRMNEKLLRMPKAARQQARQRLFAELDPHLATKGSNECPPLSEVLTDPPSMRARLDVLIEALP
jgi:N-methylhydantoinase B